MAGYVIGHINVKDPAKWGEYRSRVPASLERWGGEVILRGRRAVVLTGDHSYGDTVVIRFPDAGAAENWYRSPEYQSLIPVRQQGADMVLIVFEE